MKFSISREILIVKEFLKRGKCLIFFAFLLYIINSMATISAPLYLGKLVDFFKGKKIGLNSIITNGTWFLGLYALLMVTQIASSVLLAVINKKARIHYQSLILDKILKLPYLQQIK
jgi:ABC-type multidrug transport system fused ATPase/permease subunit